MDRTPTPASLARPRRPRPGSFRAKHDAERQREPLRGRPAISANDFSFGLHAGHLALVCPSCGHAVYPLTALGQAYSKVKVHIDQEHNG
jgi:hypothetical protein